MLHDSHYDQSCGQGNRRATARLSIRFAVSDAEIPACNVSPLCLEVTDEVVRCSHAKTRADRGVRPDRNIFRGKRGHGGERSWPQSPQHRELNLSSCVLASADAPVPCVRIRGRSLLSASYCSRPQRGDAAVETKGWRCNCCSQRCFPLQEIWQHGRNRRRPSSAIPSSAIPGAGSLPALVPNAPHSNRAECAFDEKGGGEAFAAAIMIRLARCRTPQISWHASAAMRTRSRASKTHTATLAGRLEGDRLFPV